MRFAEDISIDAPTDCGTASFTAENIVDFAKRYDPQPFHLSEEGGAQSLLFGRLTASGLQTAAEARFAVMRAVMGAVCFLGSPGAKRFQMHKPVFPGTVLKFTHTFTEIHPLQSWDGVALARSVTRAHARDGALVMTMDHFDWIGSRRLSLASDAALSPSLMSSDDAAPGLEPLRRVMHFERSAAQDDRSALYLEDCPKGATFSTGEFSVEAEDVAYFRSRFCARAADGRVLPNEWYNVLLGIRIFADVFWLRAANVGGSGMDDARWPAPIEAGDVLRGRLTVSQSRQLRTKPSLGSVVSECVCVNQRGEVVTSFSVTTFLRVRELKAAPLSPGP